MARDAVEARLAQIAVAYAERYALMENKPFEDQPFNQMTIDLSLNKAGLGVTDSRFTYYFTDEGPADDEGIHDHVLYFVQGSFSNSMGCYNHYVELLYDSETGAPMFALVSMILNDDESTRHTVRVYYDEKGRVINTLHAPDNIFDWVENSPFVTDITSIDDVNKLIRFHRAVYDAAVRPLYDYR